MNRNKHWITSTALLAVAAFVGSANADIILIDKTFDNVANDTGPAFQGVNNGTNSGSGSANLTTGLITLGGTNNSRGFNNVSTVNIPTADPTAKGFYVTFVVDATNQNVSSLLANGMFFGVVSGAGATSTTTPWNSNSQIFGYVPGSTSHGDNVMAQRNGSAFTYTALGGTAPTNASFQDGFTLTIGLFNNDTWTITSTGLSTDLNGSGSLDTVNQFAYADIASSVGTFAGFQHNNTSTLDISRITLETTTVPEPSSAILLGAMGVLALRRRRD